MKNVIITSVLALMLATGANAKTSMLARMALPLIMVILGILQSVILEQLIQKHPKGM